MELSDSNQQDQQNQQEHNNINVRASRRRRVSTDSEDDEFMGFHGRNFKKQKTSDIGDFKHIKGDKVRSRDFPISFLSALMVVGPSLTYLSYMYKSQIQSLIPYRMPYQFDSVITCIIVGLFYVLSVACVLTALFKCTFTDPGIIPAIPSQNISKDKEYCKHTSFDISLDVKYKDQSELSNLLTGENFYDTAIFKLLPEKSPEETNHPDPEAQRLAFCTTCNILRPPRSFHCGVCNVCIEIHDHHCPWVGTCVGKRNHRYFCLFLLMTSIHSLFTFILTLTSIFKTFDFKSNNNMDDPQKIVQIFLVVYSGLFSCSLAGFWGFQNYLVLQNLTSNEHLRRRWNARRRHTELQLQIQKPSVFERMRWFYTSQLSQSKVEIWASKQKQGVMKKIDDDEEKLVNQEELKIINNESLLKDYGIFINKQN